MAWFKREKYTIVIRSFTHEVDHRLTTYLVNVQMLINLRAAV